MAATGAAAAATTGCGVAVGAVPAGADVAPPLEASGAAGAGLLLGSTGKAALAPAGGATLGGCASVGAAGGCTRGSPPAGVVASGVGGGGSGLGTGAAVAGGVAAEGALLVPGALLVAGAVAAEDGPAVVGAPEVCAWASETTVADARKT